MKTWTATHPRPKRRLDEFERALSDDGHTPGQESSDLTDLLHIIGWITVGWLLVLAVGWLVW